MGFCSLRVETPPAIEPVTDADAEAYLRLDGVDPQVRGFIVAARAWVELYLDRALITQTLRYTLSPSQPGGNMGSVINPIIFVTPLSWWPVSGMPIELPMAPVQAVTAISQRARDGAVHTLDPAADYFADTSNEPGRVTLRTIGQSVGSDLSITYIAGYGATVDAVPMPIRLAIKVLLAHFYERRGDGEDAPQPQAVKALLNPYRQVTFA